jgi:hypothetical protein
MLDLGEAARTLSPRLRSCLAAPIVHRDECLGVLSLYSGVANGFNEDHQRLAEGAANLAAERIQSIASPATTNPTRPTLANSLVYVRVSEANISNDIIERTFHQLEQHLKANIQSDDKLLRPSDFEILILLQRRDSLASMAAAGRIQGRVESFIERLPTAERPRIYVDTDQGVHVTTTLEAATRLARLRFETSESGDDQSNRGSIH